MRFLRSVTLRDETSHEQGWAAPLGCLRLALTTAGEPLVAGLRERPEAVASRGRTGPPPLAQNDNSREACPRRCRCLPFRG